MVHYKNHHTSNKASSLKVSEKSLSEQIAAFQRAGGKIEVLGNTPALRRTNAKAAEALGAGNGADGELASNDAKK